MLLKTKPIGALNSERLEYLRERADQLSVDVDESDARGGEDSWFLYGTHYSTVASVLYFLCRLEPFTSHHIQLQGGQFDAPDRLFRSLAETWHSVTHSRSDFKEMVRA